MHKSVRLFLSSIVLIVILFGSPPTSTAHAATIWTVTSISDSTTATPGNCPHPTNCRLRDAIAAASAGDTIIFDAGLSGQTIPLSATITLSKNVTMDGSALPSQITISGDKYGDGSVRIKVFRVDSGVTVTLNSLTIDKGLYYALGYGSGGAVENKGTITIENCMFSNNTAGAGGGAIYNNNGIMTITDSTFSENYVDGDGAAIYNQGTMTVTGSIFLNNHAVGGGGVYNKGDLTITESSFSNNTASSYGGGMWNDSGNVILTDSSFTGNYANGGGAGIENFGAGNSLVITNSVFSNNSVSSDYGSGGGIEHSGGTIDEPGLLTITNSIFVNNSARNGGGIYTTGTAMVASSTFVDNTAIGFDGGAIYHFLGGTLTVANSTFYNNSANYSGGGISSSAGDGLILINNSFSNNSAGDKGGGIYAGDVSYANNIIANSTSGGDCHIYGVISINKNNLVEDGSCIASLSGDPKLGLLADNGGPTQTMALQSGSPAIDAGDDVACAASPINNLDQRGMTRPMGTHCDIGAYELDYLFADVADTYWAASYIERLYNAGITGGCATNPLRYCPESDVSRAQMAVFLLKGVHGSSYTPPAVGGSTGFADVPTSYWAAPWIKQLAAEGVTGGCGGGNFCPDTPVTRAQMAVFLLKSKHGVAYLPPAATGVFADVPVGYWADKWIEQLAAEGITGGCGGGNYCPDTSVTRAQMAVFLVKTFNLP